MMTLKMALTTAILALTWGVQSIYCHSLYNQGSERNSNDFSSWLARKEHLPLKVSDYDNIAAAYKHRASGLTETLVQELLPYVVRDLIRELNTAKELLSSDDYSSEENPDVEQVRKRKAFWQPLRGPLPVETRFANFGSRLEPEKGRLGHNNGNNIKAMKAMRYG